jgi:putative membrane protein insertion efficiency factor
MARVGDTMALVADAMARGADAMARCGAIFLIFLITFLIMGYRAMVSPWLTAIAGPACRYTPTCSEFAREAIVEYGIGRGCWMALKRIGRCRPAGGWGYDPVTRRGDDIGIVATSIDGLGLAARPEAKPSA